MSDLRLEIAKALRRQQGGSRGEKNVRVLAANLIEGAVARLKEPALRVATDPDKLVLEPSGEEFHSPEQGKSAARALREATRRWRKEQE